MKKTPKYRGFTLIEVTIVLAIAGLIFLIVFLAVSQAQAARRDTQRKADASKMFAAVNQYASNNSGGLPNNGTTTLFPGAACTNSATTFCGQYLNGANFKSPAGTSYTITLGTAVPNGDAKLTYKDQQICNGVSMAAGSARQFAILYWQEKGGAYCLDNTQ